MIDHRRASISLITITLADVMNGRLIDVSSNFSRMVGVNSLTAMTWADRMLLHMFIKTHTLSNSRSVESHVVRWLPPFGFDSIVITLRRGVN